MKALAIDRLIPLGDAIGRIQQVQNADTLNVVVMVGSLRGIPLEGGYHPPESVTITLKPQEIVDFARQLAEAAFAMQPPLRNQLIINLGGKI